ncbi:MAG TPA: 3-deoxy-manno-octulosonate cytidylyltransferase [Desulfomonilaceae bacterium]|nr:3-deoxy-manno-octulosonate cytidylyltransferase [Desulfomonilaceae bacterium]
MMGAYRRFDLLGSLAFMKEYFPKIVVFIPARAESTRFPGKPLADILGKPMIVRVLERALRSPMVHEVYVATDSRKILEAVQSHGGRGLMTASDHASGTDRIAEAARQTGLENSDIVVNIQGDQPLFDPAMVEEVVRPLLEDATVPMSTLIYKILRTEEITHPNAVKTVMDKEGFAIYFSRATIPFFRDDGRNREYFKHHGIYAYRNDFLQKFSKLPQGYLERAERLEQLRALENGFRIKTVLTDRDSVEVDTPEDLQRVRETYGKMI